MSNLHVAVAMLASTHPHLVMAVPRGERPDTIMEKPVLSGAFKVDTGCGSDVLNDPALEAYVERGSPVIFAFERKVDLRKVLDRRASFAARGYGLWRVESDDLPCQQHQ